jgi:hypothetical protein
MIRQTSPDKIRSKLVKYRLGDCLIIRLSNNHYIGALMTGKFNAYYNFTFMDFLKDKKPGMDDFINGQFFGTRFGSWEDLTYAVDQRMINCKYVDSINDIEKVGNLTLTSKLFSAGYAYLNDIDEMHKYYCEEMPIRIEKTKNAEKFPEIAFVSKHLIEMKNIIEE